MRETTLWPKFLARDERRLALEKRRRTLALLDPKGRISEAERLAEVLENDGEVKTWRWIRMRAQATDRRLRRCLVWLYGNTIGRI